MSPVAKLQAEWSILHSKGRSGETIFHCYHYIPFISDHSPAIREGTSSSKSLKEWLREIWDWKALDTLTVNTGPCMYLASPFSSITPLLEDSSGNFLWSQERDQRGHEGHMPIIIQLLKGQTFRGEFLPSACPQTLPQARHAADPGVTNTQF